MFSKRILHTCGGFVAGVALATAGSLAHAETVKIGLPAPVTGPGASIGDLMVKGAQAGAAAINSGGLAGPHKVELIIEDGACSPAGASAATEKLIGSHKVHVLIGALCSSATMAASEIAQREKIPMVVAISSADKITQRGYEYIFRSTPSNGQIVKVSSDYVLKKVNPKSMAFIFESTDWGEDAATQFKNRVEKAGIEIAGFEGVPRTVQNFLPMLTKLKRKKPDATFVVLLAPQALQVMNQAAEVDYRTQWYGMQTMGSPTFLDKVGPNADGLLVYSLFEPIMSDPDIVKFIDRYKRIHRKKPGHFAALAYDAMIVLANAIKKAGADSAKLRDALAGTKDVTGVSGDTTFDSKGQASKIGFVINWRDKERHIVFP